ncbi:MAG: DUF262 domain-containing protein [Pseudonocardiaceae bacterium]
MTPSAPLGGSGSGSYRIPQLVSLAGEGSIRVPTFQRAFVWDAGDVLNLFDSFFRTFPVGTLLLWRRHGPAGPINLGPIQLDGHEDQNTLWVVDGQQRITSIFGALSPNHKGVDDRFEVYFSLATGRFVNPRRGVVPPRAIPVREALETRSLLNWLRQHSEDLEPGDYDLADRLGGALRDYTIPAYVVSGEDQGVLREVFDRVNSSGKPITRAQVFHALFAGEAEPGSPATVVEELRRLNFGALDENRIVQSLLAIRGGDVQRDIHEEFEKGEDLADWYDKTEEALARSIEFLRSEGVEHLRLVPNTLPIPVLAAFFHLHPEPEPWTLRLLSHWLWRGWVHGFGRTEGGQTPTLRRAIRSVNPGRGDQDPPSEYDAVKALLDYVSDREAPEVSLRNFRTNFSSGRFVLLALASLRPRRADGSVLNLSDELELYGVDAITELVPGHRSNAAARGFWPRRQEISSADPAVLESHAIDLGTAEALGQGDVPKFLELRGKRIAQLVSEFLNSRLETDLVVRPSIADLIVAGTAEED